MGASTFLLFLTPHSPLAHPWPLTSGHITAGFIGVACYKFIPDMTLALATAVSLSVFIMYQMSCMHPPATATAMITIIGGELVAAQSSSLAYTAIVLNVTILLVLTVVLNNLIPGRRYPLNHQHHPHHRKFQSQCLAETKPLDEEDFKCFESDGFLYRCNRGGSCRFV